MTEDRLEEIRDHVRRFGLVKAQDARELLAEVDRLRHVIAEAIESTEKNTTEIVNMQKFIKGDSPR